MGVYSLLLAIANEGTEAALKSAEEFVFINHGKPREPHNAYTFAISIVISFLLLYWGGFFG